MNSVLYAAYGSNLHPIRLSERLSSARLKGTGFLPGMSVGFHKRSVDGSGKCTIDEGGDGVYVAVYEISTDDKKRLDAIEGVGQGYTDETVDVPGFSACMTYVGEPGYIDRSSVPYLWYRELVVLGCRYHGFPRHYIERLEATDVLADPDPERRAKNSELIERIRND